MADQQLLIMEGSSDHDVIERLLERRGISSAKFDFKPQGGISKLLILYAAMSDAFSNC